MKPEDDRAARFAAFCDRVLSERLDAPGLEFLARELERSAVASTDDAARFGVRLGLASRHARRRPLDLSDAEHDLGRSIVQGLDPEAWTLLDVLRVRLVLALPDLAGERTAGLLEEAFRYGDEGETCALLRSVPVLPAPERFLWRVTEGCRSNMRSVFEAAATDTPFCVQHFDDVAWRQALLKSLFIGAPLWRVFGVDERLDAETQRMALDYADERRSAGRSVPPELWMLLAGAELDERALHSVEAEVTVGPGPARAGAYLALARGGRTGILRAHVEHETNELSAAVGRAALAGRHDSRAFASLRAREEIELLGPNAARRMAVDA
ncbi:hypothetical protein Pla163_18580 [Planctomycetes bacterium Pla163]|uniref:Uncharacterized protein n=1 Tax=Rohdeia mirabilis TaxID=2528008 RepID=A0A518CZT4_9BACT|nr:hypothetical protein Pla163_18580 [Planctomycetes bacterium Pla163]